MLKKILNRLSQIELAITGTIFIVALTILAINIILRYFFHSATTWAEEVMRYIMIWVTFLGASLCVEDDLHVGIDVFVQMSSPKTQKKFKIFAQLCGIFFSGYMTVFGGQNVIFLIETGQRSSALMMPMWIVYFSMPLGAFCMTLRYIGKLIHYIHLPPSAFEISDEENEPKNPNDIDILTLN